MIVGEALNRRADLQRRIAQLQERLRTNVVAQEGEAPAEDPAALIEELEAACDALGGLIGRINHTNAESRLATGETVTEALARRDVLGWRQDGLRAAVKAAANDGQQGIFRYSRSEIRMVRQVSVRELQARIDELARRRRELDSELQAHNWTTHLLE